MSALHALVLGLVQGITEFLPISSSGHLILVPALLGWPDQGLGFDAATHLGTSLALVCYFARDLLRIAGGILERRAEEVRLAVAVIVGTLPAGLAGLLFERAIETRLRSAVVVAVTTIGWGLVLGWADRRAAHARPADIRDVGVPRGFAIGCAQAIALVPGTSRSGITITAGLAAGLDRPTAARFAFLLGLPITAAAGLLKTAKLLGGGLGTADLTPLTVGVVAAFASGLAAVWFLVRHLQRRTLTVFVVYRIALGLLILGLVAAGAV